ncbi:hypothetical protein L204_106024 [Cryptococcus depauperatus]
MLKTQPKANQEQFNRPLVVRCAYEGSSRRVNFPSAASCRLESLRSRVEECFSLSAASFWLAYTDDDGEEFNISSENDLTEAIAYFISGDNDTAQPNYATLGNQASFSSSSTRITVRLDVVVEYDGPSLSDISSISSFQTGSGSERDSIHRSGYGGTYRSSLDQSIRETIYEEETSDYDDENVKGAATQLMVNRLSRASIDDDCSSGHYSDPLTLKRRTDSEGAASAFTVHPPLSSSAPQSPSPLMGPESGAAPSSLAQSELGSKWLIEQSKLVSRNMGYGARTGRLSKYDSDEESFASDDDRSSNFELVRDARGRYYYSYQTDIRLPSDGDDIGPLEHDIDLQRQSTRHSISLSSAVSSSSVLHSNRTSLSPSIDEILGPPILAPDCSVCGVRLDYLRYVCRTCGEGEMWQGNTSSEAGLAPRRQSSSDGGRSSNTTKLAVSLSTSDTGSQTVYNDPLCRLNGSLTANIPDDLPQVLGGSYRQPLPDYTPSHSPDSRLHPLLAVTDRPLSWNTGYELCAGCVEIHGIQHSKVASGIPGSELNEAELQPRNIVGGLRHTFKERVWGPNGWTDVEYNEDSKCTICKTLHFHDRFKCVTCPKFNLCISCYQKVDEIHPTHAFLSLPDKPLPRNGPLVRDMQMQESTASQLVRHPGAFCHNCLKDIVGPRFHCAVCPSWDLCIQCESIQVSDGEGSGHHADHIMMKIPVPLPSSEIEAVSRRARDRWIQQDRTVATAGFHQHTLFTRSPSPSGDTSTLYAPTAGRRAASPLPPSQIIHITTRDVLDHGVRCGNCSEWIVGKRYQCANCPSDPVGFNLCSICELRSYKIHDPNHVFLKFDRPVHIPLRFSRPLLPLLYRHPAGRVPSSALTTINPRDPTAYLKHVLHQETLCDVHGEQIRGVWLRCAHCASGFDICQRAESLADHDVTHVFVVFKARVNMATFRHVADLAATHSKPLIRQQVYIS